MEIDIKKTIFLSFATVMCVAVGCSEPAGRVSGERTHSYGEPLKLTPTTQIQSVAYTLTGPNGFSAPPGSFSVASLREIEGTITQVPVGGPYTLALTATSTDGHVTCTGSQSGIRVECPDNRPDDEKNVTMTCTRAMPVPIPGDPYWQDAEPTLLLPAGVSLVCAPPAAGAPVDCIPTTCLAEGLQCGELSDGCGSVLNCGICTAPETCGGGGQPGVCGTATADPCDVSTTMCLQAHDKPTSPAGAQCSTCLANSPCLDPTKLNGSCEAVTGNKASCEAMFGTMSPVTETQVCLHTLKDILSSSCSWSQREMTCLCGTSDTADCVSGALPATGAAYQDYACDFDTNSTYAMWIDRTVQTTGAGQATALLQCAAEFGCDCSPTPASAGARYWVGGPGDADSPSHWSTTSGGQPGASVPTSANDVYFDANGGFGSGTNLISSSNAGTSTPYVLYAHSITMSQPQPITWDTNVSLNSSGSATLANVSPSSLTTLSLAGLEPGNFQPNGITFATISVGNRTITLQSDLIGGFQNFSVAGELDANGHNIYGTGPLQGGTIHLGSGLIQVSSFSATAVDASNTASLEIAAGGTISAPGATLNLVAFDGDGAIAHEEGGITIGHATLRAGSTYLFENGQTTTFLNPPVIIGTAAAPTAFGTTTAGAANAVLSCAQSVALDGLLNVSGITATGAGWTATNATIDASSQGWTQTPWATLGTMPSESCVPAVLLTDGSVLCSSALPSPHWYKLTPDASGNYRNGQWTQIQSSNLGRFAFPSAILRSGLYWVAGGEVVSTNDGTVTAGTDHNAVEIYDPSANTWTVQDDDPEQIFNGTSPGIYDAASTILSDGRVFCSSFEGGTQYGFIAEAFDPTQPAGRNPSLQWSPTSLGSPGGPLSTHEQGFTLLQDGRVFTISAEDTTPAAIYTPSTPSSADLWTRGATPTQPLFILASGFDEIGAQLLLYSGQVLVLGVPDSRVPGSLQHNNIYDPSTGQGQWANDVQDGPASDGHGFADNAGCVMANGKVLTPVDMGTRLGSEAAIPYVFDPSTKHFAPEHAVPMGEAILAGPALTLPNGQVLLYADPNFLLYTPQGPQESLGAPSITEVKYFPSMHSYTLFGTTLNGMTTGCGEGDDYEGIATNYPIVSATNVVSGVTYYFRSHNFDQMAPQPNHAGSAQFAVPTGAPTPPPGAYELTVSASGARTSTIVLLGYSVSLTCPVLPQNSSATCTLTLANPAPGGGLPVQLSLTSPSSDAGYLTVRPSSLLVPAGQTQAGFVVQSGSVPSTRAVGVDAVAGGIVSHSNIIVSQ